MLRQINRLKKRASFSYIYKRGRGISSPYLTIVSLYSAKTKVVKIGISVSNKVGKAVKRNLVKRRLRSILREIAPSLDCHYQLIVVAKNGITERSFANIRDELYALIDKSKLKRVV